MSSTNFDSYAAYYDLLYVDKDYAREAAFVAGLIRKFAPECRDVLDLGCGTGVHAHLLAEEGFSVTGVDRSADMLKIASSEARGRSAIQPVFHQADIRNFTLDAQFDVVVSLFDVFSYLTSNDDLRRTLRAIRNHLRPGGLLMFDCWYGPAVFANRPAQRIKRFENDSYRIVRISEPEFDMHRNVTDVHFELFVEDKTSGAISVLNELHPMRCYFEPELDDLFSQLGFARAFACQWHSGDAPNLDSWSAMFGYSLTDDGP